MYAKYIFPSILDVTLNTPCMKTRAIELNKRRCESAEEWNDIDYIEN